MSTSEDGHLRPGATLTVAISAATLGVTPAFLTGAMAVLVRSDLRFGEAQLGLAISAFFGAAALTSAPAGRVVERLGGRRGMILGASGTAVALAGVGFAASSWWHLTALLLLGGASHGVTQPASNLALARGVRFGRQGLAFGVKQSAIPAATLIGGGAVPLVGLTVGWRWSYGGLAVLAALFALALGVSRFPPDGRMERSPHGDAASLPLIVLGVGAAIGMAAGNSLGSFYVESAVAFGVATGTAGLWLAVGSAGSIVARIAWGWLADRRDGRNLRFVAALMAIGALAYLVLAFGRGPALAIATVAAFATGWGWPGLLMYAVVRHARGAPAAATGIVLSGAFVGGTLGPVGFGAIVERSSYAVAWTVAGAFLLAAAACIAFARRVLRADLVRRRVDAGGASTTTFATGVSTWDR